MAPVTKKKRNRSKHFFKEWREFRGMTQDTAIEHLDWSQSKMSRLEAGTTPYSQDDLEAAAEVYQCTVADILTRNPLTAISDDASTPAWTMQDVRPHINTVTRAMVQILYEREAIDVSADDFVAALNELLEESLERPDASERDFENVVRFRLRRIA